MVQELTKLSNETLDKLFAACHEAAEELRGSKSLKEAMNNEAFCEALKLELATFDAIKFKYLTKQRESL